MSTDIVKAGGSLAIRPDQTTWTPEQAAVLQQSGISDDVTAAELSGFLHLCQKTQLDPFSRQIYLIGRKDKKVGRVVFTPQTGIDGYRVIAHRVIAASGESFGYEDTQWCDASGRWRDVWLSNEPPAAAKVTVLRNGHRFPAIALYREYVQTGWESKPIGLWGKMPASQLAKCAEALALRKAFPHDLAGVYTAEEMAQADNPGADERHLRAVQPGEADPWTTASPASEAATAGPPVEPHRPAQDIADEAEKASTKERFAQLWGLAKTGRLMEAPVKAADTGEIDELGQYLTRRAKAFAEPQTSLGGDEVTDAEVVAEGETEADRAERDLRAVAAKVGLTNLDEEFERSYGLPIAQAGAQQMRQMQAILTGSAA